MALTYRGDTDIAEEPGARISEDIYGIETLTRTFTGNKSGWATFRGQYYPERPDDDFPHLFLTNREPTFDRAFVRAVLTWKGIAQYAGNGITRPQYSTGLRREQVTLRKPNGDAMQVTYWSPVTTIRYGAKDRPKAQNFKGVMLQQDLTLQVIKTTGNKAPISFRKEIINLPGGASEPFYWAKKVVLLSTFSTNQQGKVWEVTEENQLYMVDGHDENGGKELGGDVGPVIPGQ